MVEWYSPLGLGAQVVAAQLHTLDGAPDNRFRAAEHRLNHVPIAMSELFTVGQSLPLSALQTQQGFLLVADLRAGGAAVSAFDSAGMWRLPYRPLALRLLPFIARADGSVGRISHQNAEPAAKPAQTHVPVQRALANFAASLKAAHTLLEVALEAQMLTLCEGPDEPNGMGYLELAPPPETLSPAQFPSCKLVEAIRFSQKRVGVAPQSAYAAQALAKRRPDGPCAAQFLSFDEAIRFNFADKGA